jgi:hypothetical protein
LPTMSDVPREELEPPPRLPEGYSLNCTNEDGPMILAREDDGRVVAVFPALTSAEEIEALAFGRIVHELLLLFWVGYAGFRHPVGSRLCLKALTCT